MSSIFILLGPELGEKADFITKIKAGLKKKSENNYETFKFYPDEIEKQSLVEILKNGGLFSSWKLVLVYNARSLNQGQVNDLKDFCRKPSEGTVLVLLSEEMKINSELMALVPKKNTVMFWEMFENKKRDWINSWFHRQEKHVDPEAVELLLELVENNTLDLKRECGHLVLFYADEKNITAQMVEDFIYHSREENIFSLFSRIAALQYQEALESFCKLLNSGEIQPGTLVSSLYWQFRKLASYVSLAAQRYHHNEICEKLGIKGKRNQQQYLGASRNFTLHNCADITKLFTSYDRILKESRGEMGRIQAEVFLYYLIVKKGSRTTLPMTLTVK